MRRLSVFAHEIGKKKRDVIIPRHFPESGNVNFRVGIGIARMPAGVGGVVVSRISRIPSEHDIAEAESFIQHGKKFVAVHHLAAQDAVNIGNGYLHFSSGIIFHIRKRFACLIFY